jgi:hypothetical protein
MSPEERALADEWESERLRDQSRAHHPEEWETTAGPPEPTMADEVGDAAYNSFFTLGTRPRVN